MITFDPATDFLNVTDGMQSATLNRRAGREGGTVSLHALRRAVRRSEMIASGGQYTSQDTVFHFPASEALTRPLPGDTLTDHDGTVWTILSIERATFATRLRCVCRDLSIEPGLNTLLTVQVANSAKGDGGAQVLTWSSALVNVRGLIQSAEASEEQQYGHRVLKRSFRIFVEGDLDIRRQHRIVGDDGTVYRVTGWEDRARIDHLMSLSAEEWQGGVS